MSEAIGELQRRLANMIRRGVIHSLQEGQIPKCRVDIGDIITGWLPLCQWFSGLNRSDSNPYAVGDAVTVLSEAGELTNGRVYPGWNTGMQPVPPGSEAEHITRYGDGTEIRYNRESHALTVVLAENGTYRIVGEGTLDGNVTITKTLTVDDDAFVQGELMADGNISSAAEVSDSKGNLSGIRETFNDHDHPGDSGGTTKKPNQKM